MKSFVYACGLFWLLSSMHGAVAQTRSSSSVSGTVVQGGIVCPLLRKADGEIVPLTGVAMDAFAEGTQLSLTGSFVARSTCQQGQRTFAVERVVSVNGKPRP
jgi:hypothetical protein